MKDLKANDLLDGRYRVIDTLAQGGFGKTYIAEDTRRPTNPQCVIKQLKPPTNHPKSLENARRLFRTEAETLERLGKNDQIPMLLAYFEEDEEFYLVQECIEGNTLSSEIKPGQSWSESQVRQMLQEVLRALSFIHQNRVIHRDIKPDNIIRRHRDNKLVLVDFGTVKQIRGPNHQVSGTIAVGTPGYMSTEQGRGNPRANSDIYGLGMMAIQAVTGLTINQIQEDPNTGEVIWEPWAKISDDLKSILSKMVRYHFRERYQSATEVLQALESYPQVSLPQQKSVQQPTIIQPTLVPQQYSRVPSTAIPSIPQSGQPQPTEISIPPSQLSATAPSSAQPFAGSQYSGVASQNPRRLLLPIGVATTVIGILIYLIWLFLFNNTPKTTESPNPSPFATNAQITPTSTPDQSNIQARISLGEKSLVKTEEVGTPNLQFQAAKQQGMQAMAAGDYDKAMSNFEVAIRKYPNAPETLIYLNNARIGNQKSHTIAVAGPIATDPDGTLAIVRGVAQAQDEINQTGGINGVPLKVVITSDDQNPDTAKQIASALVNNPEILGVIGHSASSVTLAAGEVYNSGKLAAISAVSTSVKLSNFSPYVFRSVPNDAFSARALANYMLTELKKQNAAVFYNSKSDYSKSLRTEFVTAVSLGGGQVVDEIDISNPDFNPATPVQQAIERGAQVLFLAPNPAVLDQALEVVKVNGKRLSLLGGDVMYSPKTLEKGAENALEMVVAVFWDIDSNPQSDFVRKSKALWNAEVNWRTAMAYDGTQALIEALKRNPTRAGVQEALSASDFVAPGVSGSIRFLRSGDRNGSVQLVKILPKQNTSSGYDFLPIPSN
ncbi:bifunctional serine/threonine-protein kinase/ABC transporter substrate-binding protein [Moorena producens]|uniref:bifunctional serine/threonine-protein kinase/ABC transporter substrate-binding protein n=1 Tax=Moorena producens TaxID=1155739 RepID=UPI000B102E96|nr:bifunctional serine/threonine-protein kinase/ABC transporter substrate-binding protein [Moorena producens]